MNIIMYWIIFYILKLLTISYLYINLTNTILKIIHNSRINTWWNHIIAPVTFAIYLSFFINETFDYFFYFTFLISSFFLAFLGYLTNDFFDKKQDLEVKKKNFFENYDKPTSILILLATLIFTLSIWFIVPINNNGKYFILLIEIFLFVLYSAPHIRLKEKKWLGLITDSLYSHVLPWAMVLLIYNDTAYFTLYISLIIWQLIIGVRNILTHQLDDYNYDIKNTKTYVTESGLTFSKKQLKKTISIESFILILIIILGSIYLSINILYVFFVALLINLFYEIRLFSNTKKTSSSNIFLNNLYEYILPFVFVCFLAYSIHNYYIILLHLILFPKFALFLKEIFSLKNKPSLSKFKLVINYFIYYSIISQIYCLGYISNI